MTAYSLPPVLSKTTKPLLLIVALIGLAHMAVSIALTLAIARAFDWVASPNLDRRHFAAMLIGALVLGAAGFAIRYGERAVSERFGQEYVHRVRMRLWDHLQTLPANSIAGQRKGATVLRFIGDLSALKNWVSKGMVGATFAALTIAGGMIALFILDWRLGSVAAAALLATLVFQVYWTQRLLDQVRVLRKHRSRLATDIVERIQALAVVQSSNQNRRERGRIKKRSRAVVDASVSTAKASGVLLGSGEFASIALMTAILLLGALQVRSGNLSPSSLVAALVLSRYLRPPLRRLSRMQEQWMRGSVSRGKLEKFLALQGLVEPKKALKLKPGGTNGKGRLRLRNLQLDCIENSLSATAPAGSKIRLVGANGVGKSTLLRIVAGLEQPRAGMVSLDGRDLSRCSLATVRSAISLVSPDLPLMRGSLRRNLTYASPRATEHQIAEALQAAGLEKFVARLTRGFKTWIDDGGGNLSSGERFRVRLARALLVKPRILLVDEADAALDKVGRKVLRRVVRNFDGTVVFVWRGKDAPPHNSIWELSADGLRAQAARNSVNRVSHVIDPEAAPETTKITQLEQHREQRLNRDQTQASSSASRGRVR